MLVNLANLDLSSLGIRDYSESGLVARTLGDLPDGKPGTTLVVSGELFAAAVDNGREDVAYVGFVDGRFGLIGPRSPERRALSWPGGVQPCAACDGSGHEGYDETGGNVACPSCNGTGKAAQPTVRVTVSPIPKGWIIALGGKVQGGLPGLPGALDAAQTLAPTELVVVVPKSLAGQAKATCKKLRGQGRLAVFVRVVEKADNASFSTALVEIGAGAVVAKVDGETVYEGAGFKSALKAVFAAIEGGRARIVAVVPKAHRERAVAAIAEVRAEIGASTYVEVRAR